MPIYVTRDGSEVTYLVLGPPGEPLVCLPGGPLRAPRYLGTLGGLAAHRELVLVELPARRVDRLVADLEALRCHLGRDRLEILAHSAGATLALLYAAGHPHRIDRLALIAPSLRAVRSSPPDGVWSDWVSKRFAESCYPEASAALAAREAGDDSAALQLAAAPFF